MARDPKVFAAYGHDLLWCLYSIASTSANPELSRTVWSAAIERARKYRQLYPTLPADVGARELIAWAFGSYAADMIGVRRAAARFRAEDFLLFDRRASLRPTTSPMPASAAARRIRADAPYTANAAGSSLCAAAKTSGIPPSSPRTPAIATASFWARVTATCCAGPPCAGNADFADMVYAATHLVHTLNDYSRYLLAPQSSRMNSHY
jgi:hypothetical protein